MHRFFRSNTTSNPANQNKLFSSSIEEKQTEKIQDLFLQASSLNEIINRFQTQRKLLEQQKNQSEILDLIEKELQTMTTTLDIYQKIQIFIDNILKSSTQLTKSDLDILKQKQLLVKKKIKTIQEQIRFLRLLKENKKKTIKDQYKQTKHCRDNEHLFTYSKQEALYICTKCGHKINYQ